MVTPGIAYGAELRLPADFFASDDSADREVCDESDFVKRLIAAMREFGKRTRRHGNLPVYVPASLKSCSHVFVHLEIETDVLMSDDDPAFYSIMSG